MSETEPFTLRLIFTGICMFAPSTGTCLSDGICVLLPGANFGGSRKAADGFPLARHSARVRFRLKNVAGARAVPEHTSSWPLRRQRLELMVKEAPCADNDLRITTDGEGSFDFVGNLKKVAPSYSVIDPQDLTFRPSEDLQAQVIVRQGRVYTVAGPESWTFPGTLSGSDITQRLAHEIVVELKNVTKAKLVATSLSRHCPYFVESLRLAPAHGEDLVEVTIVNLEPAGTAKLRLSETSSDPDFKWYYELLEPTVLGQLRGTIKGRELPVPKPARRLMGLAILDASIGRDCFPGRV